MATSSTLSPGRIPQQPSRLPGAPEREQQAPVRRLRTAATWASRHAVLLACLSTLLVHLAWLSRQFGPDEGGYDTLARYWHQPGPYLYGPFWVDRPPALIAVYALANHLGPYGVRLVAAAVATLLVAAVAWAAGAVGGRTSARWAAWVGFGLASSIQLDARPLNGELVAAAFVAVAMAGVLHAVHRAGTHARAAAYGLLAGAAGATAVLVKQNFADGLAFAGVFLGLALLTRRNRRAYTPARVLTTAGAFGAGLLAVVGATLVWAQSHHGIGVLIYAMYGFRSDASAVMANWSLAAPLRRLDGLVTVGLFSGVLVLLLFLALRHGRRLRSLDPLPWALALTALVELVGVVGGLNFWVHYLIGLIPTVAVAAGLGVRRFLPGWWITRALVVGTAAVTAVMSPVSAVQGTAATSSDSVARWVAASAHPTDTIVVTYTHANVVQESGLRPGYPYLWSLPTRTLDPHLDGLVADLDLPAGAPTWLVQWDSLHQWGLDPARRVDAALRAHYHPVATLCGHVVWLHDGQRRTLAPASVATACSGSTP